MEAQTIVRGRPCHKPLHLECSVRALRNSLWVSLFLAQDLELHGLEHRLTATLIEVDHMLEHLLA